MSMNGRWTDELETGTVIRNKMAIKIAEKFPAGILIRGLNGALDKLEYQSGHQVILETYVVGVEDILWEPLTEARKFLDSLE